MTPGRPNSGSSFLRAALRAVKNVLEAAGLLLALLLVILAYGSMNNRWYHTLYVYSDSMSPTIQAGDLVVITRAPEKLEPGMILTLDVNGYLVTHRLVGLGPGGQIVTRGDANPTDDDWENQTVNVIGVYRFRVPYLGQLLSNFRQTIHLQSTGAWLTDKKRIMIQLKFKGKAKRPTDPPVVGKLLTATATRTATARPPEPRATATPEILPLTATVTEPPPAATPLPPEPTPTEIVPTDTPAPQENTPTAEPVVERSPEPLETETPLPEG